jgi:hypothetical protein
LGKPFDIFDHLKALAEAVEFGIKVCDTLATAAAVDCYFGVMA